MMHSLRCIQVIAGVLGRAGEAGQKKRLEDAKSGRITWLPPPGLGKPKEEQVKEKAKSNETEFPFPKSRRVELSREPELEA